MLSLSSGKGISGEDLHKAINAKDVANVREILEGGYELNISEKFLYFYNQSGIDLH